MEMSPLLVTCPHCHAEPGQMCVTPEGNRIRFRGRNEFHTRRFKAADEADYAEAIAAAEAEDLARLKSFRLPKKLKHKVRVHSHVWCDHHGCIHETTTDPYGYGEAECHQDNWRRVYIESDDKNETF